MARQTPWRPISAMSAVVVKLLSTATAGVASRRGSRRGVCSGSGESGMVSMASRSNPRENGNRSMVAPMLKQLCTVAIPTTSMACPIIGKCRMLFKR